MTSVGGIKSEIAFHGDVLNIASRLQSLCKIYNTNLLVSETFFKKININKEYSNSKCFKNIVLDGKKKEINIYAIDLKTF